MYSRTCRTASFAERRGRKPKLDSEKSGSKIGVNTWAMDCWISRSSTVGIPNGRIPSTGDTHGTRPADPTVHCPSVDADLRSGLLGIKLWFPSPPVSERRCPAGTGVHPAGLPYCRGYRPCQVLRHGQP